MSQTQAISAAAAGTFTLGGDLTVNRLGYGAMRITGKGIWGPPDDKPAALATLRRAVELGVNFIDTADSYGPNVSEELIAEALYPYPAGLVITTKGGWERSGPGPVAPQRQPPAPYRGRGRQPAALASRPHRYLPAAYSRSGGLLRCLHGNTGQAARAG